MPSVGDPPFSTAADPSLKIEARWSSPDARPRREGPSCAEDLVAMKTTRFCPSFTPCILFIFVVLGRQPEGDENNRRAPNNEFSFRIWLETGDNSGPSRFVAGAAGAADGRL